MKKSLLILSDIHGKQDWLQFYANKLTAYFDVEVCDSRVLAEIPNEIRDTDQVHQLFISGGIARAVQNIIQSTKKPDLILGFSIGGTIAWQATAQGLNASFLYLISSTRLRKETNKISVPFKLFYGMEDNYKPAEEWFLKMNCTPRLLKNEGHEFYKKEEFAKEIVEEVKKLA